MYNLINFGEQPIALDYVAEITARTMGSMGGTSYSKSVSCATDKGASGLWQWQVWSEDGSSWVQTFYTVCRYGELASVEPGCPLTTCMNDECSECATDWKA